MSPIEGEVEYHPDAENKKIRQVSRIFKIVGV
jgi:hypothetical protein